MAEEQKTGSGEDTFISHLVELRSRVVKSAAAIIIIFLCLMPWAAHLFDVLASPMMHALPAGSKMIATGVITPFLIPVKVTMLVAFIIPCRGCCISCGRLSLPVCTCMKRSWIDAVW